jgi:hypothetical protein
MMGTMIVKNRSHIEIDAKQVCRYLGYKADVEPSPRIASLLDEHLQRARELIRPAYSYVIRDVQFAAGSLVFIQGPVAFQGDSIAGLLGRCDKVAVFVLTIGDALEGTVVRLADEGLIVEAYVLDAIGSAATEGLADYVEGQIVSSAQAEGLCASRRFSPGHCDWDIGQQRMLFHALKGDWAGVHLTDDCLMVPQKSVSGVIGLAHGDTGVEDYNPCVTCDKRHCVGRR